MQELLLSKRGLNNYLYIFSYSLLIIAPICSGVSLQPLSNHIFTTEYAPVLKNIFL